MIVIGIGVGEWNRQAHVEMTSLVTSLLVGNELPVAHCTLDEHIAPVIPNDWVVIDIYV